MADPLEENLTRLREVVQRRLTTVFVRAEAPKLVPSSINRPLNPDFISSLTTSVELPDVSTSSINATTTPQIDREASWLVKRLFGWWMR